MAEAVTEATRYIYSQLQPGVPQDFLNANRGKLEDLYGKAWGIDAVVVMEPFYNPAAQLRRIDAAVLLRSFYTNSNDSSGLRREQISLVVDGPPVPRPDTELHRVWQEYSTQQDPVRNPNGDKMHLHSYEERDGHLYLRGSNYDWYGMQAIGIGLRDGSIPPSYRDKIIPTREGNTYTFSDELPNNTNSQTVVITSDHHLVLATRGSGVDYYKFATDASVGQQTNPFKEEHPFDTAVAAVSKLSGSELQLTPIAGSMRLAALFSEPIEGVANFLITMYVEETSGQINRGVIGLERASEFAKNGNTVWALPLDNPASLLRVYHQPEGFYWHGAARLKTLVALARYHGNEEVEQMIYNTRPV